MVAPLFDPLVALVRSMQSPSSYDFPNDTTIRDELTADGYQKVIRKHLDDYVVPRRKAIPQTPVSPKQGAAKVSWHEDEQIQKVIREKSWTPPVNNGLTGSIPPDRWDSKLHQLWPPAGQDFLDPRKEPGNDITNGFRLVKAYLDYGIVPAYEKIEEAIESIKDLAAFEGFCVRLASAIDAAARADVSLAEALTLWRIEGNLCTPYSQKRFLARAPTYDFMPPPPKHPERAGISLGPRSREVYITMKKGLWGYQYSLLINTTEGVEETDDVKNTFKVWAFVHWMLITGGLDFFSKKVPIRNYYKDETKRTVNRDRFVEDLANLLNKHHTARFGSSADKLSERIAECNGVLNDLECTLPSAITGRVLVAPNDPVKLVSLFLGEALIFAELYGAMVEGPVIEPTPTSQLKYLAYHTQDWRDVSDTRLDKFAMILVSAAVNAAKKDKEGKTPLGKSLRDVSTINFDKTTLGSPDFKKKKEETAEEMKERIKKEAEAHKQVCDELKKANWWASPLNRERLANYMLPAPAGTWGGWQEHRGNTARYVNVLAFYEALLG